MTLSDITVRFSCFSTSVEAHWFRFRRICLRLHRICFYNVSTRYPRVQLLFKYLPEFFVRRSYDCDVLHLRLPGCDALLYPPFFLACRQFNKTTAVEAGLKFPENVTCSTINSVSLKGDLCDYERGSDGHLTCTVKHLQDAITRKGCEIVRPFVLVYARCYAERGL